MVLHTASENSFSLSSRASLIFTANARSPPCSGLHRREKQDALCAQAPAFACVSSGSRWTVLWGYSKPRSHHPASWGHAGLTYLCWQAENTLPSLIPSLLLCKSTGKQILRWRWDSRLHFVIRPSSSCQNLIHQYYNIYTINVSSKIMQTNMHSLQSLSVL